MHQASSYIIVDVKHSLGDTNQITVYGTYLLQI
jgi:hypothetical protein